MLVVSYAFLLSLLRFSFGLTNPLCHTGQAGRDVRSVHSAIERTLGNSLSSFTQLIRAKAIFRSVSPLNKSKRDEPQTSPSPGRSIISMLIDKFKTEY